MYSRSSEQIRQGFTNYIGALIKSSELKKDEVARDIIAIICEEALSLAAESSGVLNTYKLIPMIQSIVHLIKQRYEQCGDRDKREDYETVIVILQECINDYEVKN